MEQTLLLGLGGTGSRVVNNVVKKLREEHVPINTGEVYCAVLDTNVNDNGMIANSNTGVPVIPTSKAQKIRDYFADHANLHPENWFPQEPALMEQSMIDGASEMRFKSRLAFLDCAENGRLKELETLINDMLKENKGSKIRIMIVSSLSGGTGAGMFIQTALWLRKQLHQAEVTIRGMFMLPDVFISTVDDIRNNRMTKSRHYANAYAAIRELNALNKIKNKDVDLALPEKLVLDNLFDSDADKDSGKSVYDFVFFVDNEDENHVKLNSIADYEKTVADLVYTQLYYPIADNMRSEEDNAFLSFVDNEEPLYGSCGAAVAVYDGESVAEYCALRAAQDSLSGGFGKLDNEINAEIADRKRRAKESGRPAIPLDKQARYIELFDRKANATADEVGRDRFFVSIALDVKNEHLRRGENGEMHNDPSDKVEDFIKSLNDKIAVAATRYSGTGKYMLNIDSFVEADHAKDDLLSKIESDRIELAQVLVNFEKKADEYADAIVDAVFPYSMGDVNARNAGSVYGMMTKKDPMGYQNFIHPVAIRYVLYKLLATLEKGLTGESSLAKSRGKAESGGDVGAKFDNEATKDTEQTPEEFLSSQKWYQNDEKFLDDFEKRYAEFINTKVGLCDKYEKDLLQETVYIKLITRLKALVKQTEAFFERMGDIQKALASKVLANIEETSQDTGKTLYVLGKREDKEAVYQSLDFEFESDTKINRSVLDAVYGRVCAEARPENEENIAYVRTSLTKSFLQGTVASYYDKIKNDRNNLDKVYLDLYTALCKECDVAYEAQGGQEEDDVDDLSGFTFTPGAKVDTLEEAKDADARHKTHFIEFKDRLHRLAAPFLIHEKEVSDNPLGTVTARAKTYWGFNPAMVKNFSDIGGVLGVNDDIQANKKYSKGSLICYRAVYGIEAAYIPKFRETDNGIYYKNYKATIDHMVEKVEQSKKSGSYPTRAYVSTPHLDLHWHELMPYITKEKQDQVEESFYRGLWLAIAYGKLKTDKDGNICIRRTIDGGYGSYTTEEVPVLFRGKPITKTDVVKLIDALRMDKTFTDREIPDLERRFAEDLDDMTTYVGTKVLTGLTGKKDDLHPVQLTVRYHEAPGKKKQVTARLIGGLEKIASDLAEKYHVERSEKQLEVAKYRICRKIYDSSDRTKGRSAVFGDWEQKFEEYKITKEGDTAN